MALKTMRKKFEAAKAAYENQLKMLGKELQTEIVPELAKLIPEGWYLTWHQSDKQYNDEDYYFGLDNVRLVTELEPRQGKLLKEERPRKTQRNAQYGYDEVVDYGSPAEYEWIIDEKCKKRNPDDDDGYGYNGEPGVIGLDGYGKPQLGLKKGDYKALADMIQELGDELMRKAFGDEATVRICRDGKYVVE